jgi:hypothetical protein
MFPRKEGSNMNKVHGTQGIIIRPTLEIMAKAAFLIKHQIPDFL